jgi:hypothetical protein
MNNIRMYIVDMIGEDKKESSPIISGVVNLKKEHIIMAVGFDPYDPFVKYEVMMTDIIEFEKYIEHGGGISDIIFDEAQCLEIYNKRFDKDEKSKKNSDSITRGSKDMGKIS